MSITIKDQQNWVLSRDKLSQPRWMLTFTGPTPMQNYDMTNFKATARSQYINQPLNQQILFNETHGEWKGGNFSSWRVHDVNQRSDKWRNKNYVSNGIKSPRRGSTKTLPCSYNQIKRIACDKTKTIIKQRGIRKVKWNNPLARGVENAKVDQLALVRQSKERPDK